MGLPFPTTVKIGPYVYQIVIDHELENRGLRGEARYQSLHIAISPTGALGRRKETLVHEIMHVILEVSLKDADKVDNEEFVTLTSRYIFMFLQDNPEVISFLSEV